LGLTKKEPVVDYFKILAQQFSLKRLRRSKKCLRQTSRHTCPESNPGHPQNQAGVFGTVLTYLGTLVV
jgi:hypothetical protein